jgi:hypothetical protein
VVLLSRDPLGVQPVFEGVARLTATAAAGCWRIGRRSRTALSAACAGLRAGEQLSDRIGLPLGAVGHRGRASGAPVSSARPAALTDFVG